MTDLISGVNAAAQATQSRTRETQQDVTQAGVEFEQVFLAEMLKHAGLGKTSSFGGGIGEDQFQSFLVNEQARIMAESGGIGIAKMVSAALEAKNGQ